MDGNGQAALTESQSMTQRKRLEGRAADWHPLPKKQAVTSLIPVVTDTASDAPELPGDLAGDGLSPAGLDAEPFFAKRDEETELDEPLTGEARSRRAALLSAPVQARRRYLARYVTGVVAAAGLIGVAALVQAAFASGSGAGHAASASAPPAATALDVPAAEPTPPAEATAGAAPAPPAEPAPSANPAATSAEPAAAGATSTEDGVALGDRERARRALERGHLSEAVEAAQASLAEDATDAETWLILGAAYQTGGHYREARQAFASCVDKATRGNRTECGSFLR